ncbi:MAG: flippase [Patescibacteria group bacterium]|jgi:O-antigen/teichoic acid export membrane protein|nr:flippase [Patescibacteria group bacterium]
MTLKKQIFNNTAVQLIGKILSTALNLFTFAIITRELGQSGFGAYTTVITFLSFFAILADLGLTLVTVQMLGEEQKEQNRTLGNLFGLRLSSSLLMIGLAPFVVMAFSYSQEIKLGVAIAAASFVFNALNQVMVGLFQTKLKMDRVAWAETLSRVSMLLGVIVVVKLKWGLQGVLLATSLAGFISFVLHYYFARQFAYIRPIFNWQEWKKILRLSWPLTITIALNLIYLKADTLLLSLFKSQAEVGLYGAAYKIIDVLSSLPFMFAGIILPLLVAAWQEKNKERFNTILQKSFDILAMAAIPMVIGVQFLADEIMIFIAGSEFQGAGNIFRLLIFAIAAIFLGNMMAHAIIAVKKQKSVIWIYILVSLSSLVAYLYLIPRFSYYGAAAVTIYSELSIALLSGIFICRYLKFKLNFQGLKKSLLASVLMGAIIYLLPTNLTKSAWGLILVILLAGFIYLASLLLLKAFSAKDLKLIIGKQM